MPDRDDVFSQHLAQFIADHIDSVVQLEIILLLHRNPGLRWTAQTLARELRVEPEGAHAANWRSWRHAGWRGLRTRGTNSSQNRRRSRSGSRIWLALIRSGRLRSFH